MASPPDHKPYCGYCGMWWAVETWNKIMDRQKLHLMAQRSNEPMRLPCGHDRRYERWTPYLCESCGGLGVIERWVSVAKMRRHVTGG